MYPAEIFRDTLARLLDILTRHDVRFHLTGGITSVAYGEPRMTQDIDIVVDNAALARSLAAFTAAATQAGFMLDPEAVRRAVEQRSMFQLFDMAEALKIYVYPREMIPGELSRSAMLEVFEGMLIPVVSRPDAAASKLAWASKGGHKSRRDLRQMVRRMPPAERGELDREERVAGMTVSPGPAAGTVRTASGDVVGVPTGWSLLPPGDAALTRRVKAAGEHWVVQEKVGRKLFSRGVWAATATIERIRDELAAERSTEQFARRQEASARRRGKEQSQYVEDFHAAVVGFLALHERHAELARALASAVTTHATPVGSGTVARTKRIPIERRAEAAVIAWMRHQTTAYDSMKIPRVKGKRREVRRMLAQRSKELLHRYRQGLLSSPDCPLAKALGASPGETVG